MYGGKIQEIAPVERLFDNPLHPYTQGLAGLDPARRRRDAPRRLDRDSRHGAEHPRPAGRLQVRHALPAALRAVPRHRAGARRDGARIISSAVICIRSHADMRTRRARTLILDVENLHVRFPVTRRRAAAPSRRGARRRRRVVHARRAARRSASSANRAAARPRSAARSSTSCARWPTASRSTGKILVPRARRPGRPRGAQPIARCGRTAPTSRWSSRIRTRR